MACVVGEVKVKQVVGLSFWFSVFNPNQYIKRHYVAVRLLQAFYGHLIQLQYLPRKWQLTHLIPKGNNVQLHFHRPPPRYMKAARCWGFAFTGWRGLLLRLLEYSLLLFICLMMGYWLTVDSAIVGSLQAIGWLLLVGVR